jgi:Na+/phosphate symporter
VDNEVSLLGVKRLGRETEHLPQETEHLPQFNEKTLKISAVVFNFSASIHNVPFSEMLHIFFCSSISGHLD